MSPTQFSTALGMIGWSKRHLASLLSCNTNLPSWWSTGRVTVPESLAIWLSTLAVFHDRHPAPTDWRQR
jgi:hypothetical protein